MSGEMNFCTKLSLENEKLQETRRRAIEENPDNATSISPGSSSTDTNDETLAPSPMISSQGVVNDVSRSRHEQARLALTHGKKWQVGRILNIGFLNGSFYVQKKVKRFAREWPYFCQYKT